MPAVVCPVTSATQQVLSVDSGNTCRTCIDASECGTQLGTHQLTSSECNDLNIHQYYCK